MHKLGEWLNPDDVSIGGAKHMHSLDRGLSFRDNFNTLNISSIESPLVCFGQPTAFPIPTNYAPDFRLGVSHVLFNNIWNTNYIMWYPYNHGDENILWNWNLEF
eukprot:TRINITY_DN4232_c1_g1_i1.p1 TRINITY_DN4232_c1_g1~~TRINITY_DN4232_c1_g1_i1.p1  ORF type:complete len:104 (-),score=12.26 TRINITY_DN4232_c1_g1_i1:48-359(-)